MCKDVSKKAKNFFNPMTKECVDKCPTDLEPDKANNIPATEGVCKTCAIVYKEQKKIFFDVAENKCVEICNINTFLQEDGITCDAQCTSETYKIVAVDKA